MKQTIRYLCIAAVAWLGAAGVSTAQTDGEVGVVKTAVRDVTGADSRSIRSGNSVFHMETVRTGDDSAVEISLIDESQLTIGPNAELLLDSLVYDPNRAVVEGIIDMVAGVIHFRSSVVTLDVSITTPTATIGVRGTEFDVLAQSNRTEVAVQEGTVEVSSAAGIQAVTAGEVYSVDANGNATLGAETSSAMKEAVSEMYATVANEETGEAAEQAAQTASLQPATAAQALQAVDEVREIDPAADLDSMLFLELEDGMVIIEALPDLAPGHARQVKALAEAGAYDGARFDFVRRDYAAEIAFRGRDAGIGTGETIAAEFSEIPFTRGIVGMSRPPDDENGATGAFFIALGNAANLTGSYTAWGRVVYGIEVLDQLAEGRPPANPDIVYRVRTASQILGN